MLEINDLTFAYDKTDERKIINHMNLKIEEGTFVSIVGHSGCGKSTLLRLLAGLEKPDGGRIIRKNQLDNEKMAVVFQDYSLFPWMTAEKNITFCVKKTDGVCTSEATKKAKDYLRQVGMSNEGSKYPCQLSGGMKQRVAIARAFATNAELLLMDEPFGALDMSTRSQMQKLLHKVWKENRKKRTVLFVTHDIDEAMCLSERIIFIKNGTIDGDYDIKSLKQDNQFFDKKYMEIKGRIENAFYKAC